MSITQEHRSPRAYIHYDLERIDYSVTGEELEKFCEAGQNLWKDAFLISISLGIPSLINAIADTKGSSPFQLTLPMFLNYLVGVGGLVLGLVFGIAWHRSHQSLRSLVEAIKQKPKMEIAPKVDFGTLSLAEATPKKRDNALGLEEMDMSSR